MGKRTSQLTQLTAAQVAQGDFLPIVDVSAGQTKYVTVKDLTGLPDFGWSATGESWSYSSYNSTTRIGIVTVPTDATTKYTPGMRVRFSQTTGGTKYAIVTYVTATTLDLFFPIGSLLANEAITSPVYSSLKVPVGFTANANLWKIETNSTADLSQASPVTGTIYNVGGLNVVVPRGAWELTWQADAVGQRSGAGDIGCTWGLSTSTSSFSDLDLTVFIYIQNNTELAHITSYRSKQLLLSAQATYYLDGQVFSGLTMTSLRVAGIFTPSILTAQCSYL